jgi:hypothetical protein
MLLVDQHSVGQRANFLRGLDGVFGEIGFRLAVPQRIDPRPRVFDSARIFGDGDNLEVLIFELLVNCLPAWQVKTAASP